MGFDEERERFEPEEPKFTKWDLLRTAVACGAVLGGMDVPYEGVHHHAWELVCDGYLVEKLPPFGGVGVRWVPTPEGKTASILASILGL